MTAPTTPLRCEPAQELRDVDGWHWLRCGDDGRSFIARWSAAPHSGLEPLWARYGESATPVWAAAHWDWRYLSPVAPPAEVATLRARVAELEAAMDFYACVDHYPNHNAVAPEVVRNDGGKRARAALDGKP